MVDEVTWVSFFHWTKRRRRTLIIQDLQDEAHEVPRLSFAIVAGTHGPPQEVNCAKQSRTWPHQAKS